MWMAKTEGAKLTAKPPSLKSLPPTDSALELNIKRAHYVSVLMTNCVTGNLPNMDPCQFGWELDKDGKSLKPKMLPDGVDLSPKAVLESTRCTCKVSNCKTNQCSCAKAKIPFSDFCGCCKGDQEECENQWGNYENEIETEDDQEDPDDDQEDQ